jgi:hypothetical protein
MLSDYEILIEYTDDSLIKMTTIYRFNYNPTFIETAKSILKERNIEINFNDKDFFVNLFIKGYADGWQNSLKNMFSELILNGWDVNTPIKSKEKYGDFICSIETTNIKLQEIVEKYTEIINRLCSICGGSENVFNDQTEFWIENLCEKCWIRKIENRYTVNDISENGFSYFILNSNYDVEPRYFSWSRIKNVKLKIPEASSFIYELEMDVDSQTLTFEAGRDINFYKLLEQIPIKLLSKKQFRIIRSLFANLTDCKICGRVSVYQDECLVCHANILSIMEIESAKIWKKFNNIDNLIRDKQLLFRKSIGHNVILKYRLLNDISFTAYSNFRDLTKNESE